MVILFTNYYLFNRNVLATLNRELFRKHDVVSKCVKNELVLQFSCKGTVVPPIWQLIEFAENSKSYYAALYPFLKNGKNTSLTIDKA